MGIGSLSGYSNPYTTFRMKDIQTVNAEQIQDQTQNQTQALPKEDVPLNQESAAASQNNRSRAVNLEDISLTFRKEKSVDYIDSESKLDNLDMQKAISDMKKDEVLQEYQYFVGNSGNMMNKNASPDGLVFQKMGLS